MSDLELAHALAAAAATPTAAAATTALLARRPDIAEHPLPGLPRARHRAAAAGNLPVLRVLLDHHRGWLDVPPAPCGVRSLVITGLGPKQNDLYIYQPLLSYNRQPVFIGSTFGLYVYSYDPGPLGTYSAGWCLSDYLGNGAPDFRLDLDPRPTDLPTGGLDDRPPSPARSGAARRDRPVWKWVHNKWAQWQSRRAPDGARARVSCATDPAVPAIPNSPAEAPVPTTVSVAAGGLRWVPHAASMLEAAALSGDADVLAHVAQAYRCRLPHCLAWQYDTGDGLWTPFPPAVQQQIRDGAARGLPAVPLRHGTLDLVACAYRVDGAAQGVRRCLPSVVHYCVDGKWVVTGDPKAVPEWEAAFIVCAAGAPVPDKSTLRVLCSEGVADPTLWLPACKDAGRLQWSLSTARQHQWFEEVMDDFLSQALAVPPGLVGEARGIASAARRERGARDGRPGAAARSGRDAAADSRFTDGLAAPTNSTAASAFYAADYRADIATLPFCMALPGNPLGLGFAPDALAEMGLHCVLKVYELGRQRVTLGPRHVVPIYVYTYELEGDGDQIYGAMNRAMRLCDAAALEFWRPLIWQVDCALQVCVCVLYILQMAIAHIAKEALF